MRRCKVIKISNETDLTSYINDGWDVVQIAACSDKVCWVLIKRAY